MRTIAYVTRPKRVLRGKCVANRTIRAHQYSVIRVDFCPVCPSKRNPFFHQAASDCSPPCPNGARIGSSMVDRSIYLALTFPCIRATQLNKHGAPFFGSRIAPSTPPPAGRLTFLNDIQSTFSMLAVDHSPDYVVPLLISPPLDFRPVASSLSVLSSCA